jgi:hypothetical protein
MSLTSCGGGGSSSSGPPPPPPPPPTITNVTVSTRLPYALTGETIYFTATVEGTGHFSSAVTWSVNGVNGGDAGCPTSSPAPWRAISTEKGVPRSLRTLQGAGTGITDAAGVLIGIYRARCLLPPEG